MYNQQERLDNQKKNATHLVISQVLQLFFVLPIAILCLWCSNSFSDNEKAFVIFLSSGIIFVILCILYLIAFFYWIRVRLMFNKVSFIMEDTAEIVCKNFCILTVPRLKNRAHTICAGIIYTDIKNKKYYHIFHGKIYCSPYLAFKKFVKEKTVGKQLTIKHYAGTNLLTESPITFYDYDY